MINDDSANKDGKNNSVVAPTEGRWRRDTTQEEEDLAAGIERPPDGYRGEWEDWDTDSYIGDGTEIMNMLPDNTLDDNIPEAVETTANPTFLNKDSNRYDDNNEYEYEEDEDETRPDPFFLEGTITKGVRGDSWAGWSEEPPYFDESYSEDEEMQQAVDAIQAFRDTQAATQETLRRAISQANQITSAADKPVMDRPIPSASASNESIAKELRLLRRELSDIVDVLNKIYLKL